MKFKFFKSKRAMTNANTANEKKLDRYLRHLAKSDRKKYLKEYIKALKDQMATTRKKISLRRKQLDKLKRSKK